MEDGGEIGWCLRFVEGGTIRWGILVWFPGDMQYSEIADDEYE